MRLLAATLLLELLFQSTALPVIQSEIPFQYQDGLIWLKVDVPGKTSSLNFLLDSGSSVSAVDIRTAKTCRLEIGDRQPVEGIRGQAIGYRITDLQCSVAGNAVPTSVLAVDLEAVSACCRQHVDGILGLDFFRGRIVRIDFNARRIRLLKDCDLRVANCEVLPIKRCNGAFCVPMRIAGNPTQWLRLDKGCDSALEWVVSGTTKCQMNRPSIGLMRTSVSRINTWVRFGNDFFGNLTAGIHTNQIFPGEDGLVGNGLLSKLCLTIDEPGNRVIFEKAQ
jgi:hypothetical protein